MSLPLRRICAVAAVVLVCVMGCNELLIGSTTRDAHYETRADALADGAMRRGWLPECLPLSARSIQERHITDRNGTWARFEWDPAEVDVFAKDCREVPAHDVLLPLSPGDDVEWWPHALVRESGHSSEVYTYYRCPDGPSYFALDRDAGTGFFWRN